NVYVLLAGDAPAYSNREGTGIYLSTAGRGPVQWMHMRGSVEKPEEVSSQYKLWWYPTAFAVDFTRPRRDVMWLVDMEVKGSWLATGVWKSADGGFTWKRSTQFTHPTAITIDPIDPSVVYAGGSWVTDGSWGNGGALYTTDGGATWKKNNDLPLTGNLYGVRPDPNDRDKLFYLFFGGGMMYGPKPR
ncbi:MAG: hypothetical protein HY075_08575, partial [Deltaproteobacteria bacterium]|nr:hypothetical protein [Deltaproteobacteria bacterium]